MAIANAFTRVFNLLANMGLILRDDPPKVIDMTGREWGEAVDGLELSIREFPKEDPREQVVLSVVIRNRAGKKVFTIPGWLFFYEVRIAGPDGSDAPLSGYGSQVLKPERRTERIEVTLASGEAKETDVPLGLLYEMRTGGEYRVRVSARLADGSKLMSNEIVIRVPA